MNEKVVAVVEARMGSTRLPGKSMRVLAGKPLVQHVLERAARAKTVTAVVLATSDSPKDDPLAAFVSGLGLRVHRGSESDVLARILGASREAGADVHVQCWGDCPFIEPTEIDRVVSRLVATGADLAGNGLGPDRRAPYGLDVIAFRRAALERAETLTRDSAYHREHGTTFIYQSPELFRIESIGVDDDIALPKLDLTINTEEDFRFVDSVYGKLAPHFSIRDVVGFLRAHAGAIPGRVASALGSP